MRPKTRFVRIAALVLTLLATTVQAQQVPPLINYQGQFLDAKGFPANGNYAMSFAIFNAATGGAPLYAETQNVTVNNGMFTVLIGTVNPIPQTLFDNSPNRWLEIRANGTVLTPRRRFGSVPYALGSRGHITAVTAGDGLAGGGNSGDVTLRIANNSVTSDHIMDGTIRAIDLDANSVGSDEIATNAVDSDEIAPNAVGGSEIATGAVTTLEIEDGAVTSAKIADNAVGSDKLANSIDLGEGGVSNGTLQIYSSAHNERAVELDIDPATSAGRIRTFNANGDQVTKIGSNSAGAGFIETSGSNGNPNVRLSSRSGNPNHGSIQVFDAQGVVQAGMYINAAGVGVLFADVKNFRMPHPTALDKEIWYAAIEGPEAAAYLRGTSRLANGSASVTFPEHFQIVANSENMTVYLTPLDANSMGLAVTSKSAGGFEVAELYQGNGNYEFDWEVKSVRKGYENYRVLRSKSEMGSAVSLKPTK